MRFATLALTLGAMLAVTGCSRFGSDSGLNPFGWFRSTPSVPTTLEPKGGWKTQAEDPRQPVPQILSASFQPLNEGALLMVRAFAPVKGWWDLEIITERVQPEGQLRPDDDGILRLVVVGNPPLPDSPEARMPANPQVDAINVALPISTTQLSRMRGLEIRSATGGLALKP
ncbi:hypothetical protein FQV27_04450 [Paracoccus aurantiacus]|uniref:Uncharacterized protein n=1 Tax=Paracoccus aurantiacus TaxID=2599412 RepID=A0A5C6SBC4_9RHOB|nr:hypothetical protein [Paracoccus aurantiacus]TXB71103.1 hypothetical protein FQV27_04450 [Paracoccus aurantiacus]